ncbi:uroporphyrinogen-III C-methyltransferase [Alteribacillus iranensis]|uniref:Uroporphyrinogen-III C-methyltransferase n=1 Tax=Alteribacillus iranensis TaxID=930128 RepID=A0A1I2B566_9BACI|nr:uroporphyrinogen-III C-methyltransferase [Alteribacillus iranensis]SFE51342.1 uroporphyrin-III C-methyltransferase [Alteribacillus iranensis]
MKQGYVFLTGAGPGDPKLLTIRALESIRAADIIIYDRLVNQEILNECKPDAEFIYCGKFPKNHTLRQEQINELLGEKALEGKVVTRLKGGDPFVFGRGGEEAVYLASLDIPFEVIPGVTAGIAAPAYAGIPVTHRDYGGSFAVVTGHLPHEKDKKQWEALVVGIDTVVFYMGMNQLDAIANQLMDSGRAANTPAAVIEWGTTSRQRTVTASLRTLSSEVRNRGISNPAIVIVGDVVHLRDEMNWFTEEADYLFRKPAELGNET